MGRAVGAAAQPAAAAGAAAGQHAARGPVQQQQHVRLGNAPQPAACHPSKQGGACYAPAQQLSGDSHAACLGTRCNASITLLLNVPMRWMGQMLLFCAMHELLQDCNRGSVRLLVHCAGGCKRRHAPAPHQQRARAGEDSGQGLHAQPLPNAGHAWMSVSVSPTCIACTRVVQACVAPLGRLASLVLEDALVSDPAHMPRHAHMQTAGVVQVCGS